MIGFTVKQMTNRIAKSDSFWDESLNCNRLPREARNYWQVRALNSAATTLSNGGNIHSFTTAPLP
jgi:hypothetical protein